MFNAGRIKPVQIIARCRAFFDLENDSVPTRRRNRLRNVFYLPPDHIDPFIEDLLQIIGRDLRANDLALLYRVPEGPDKLVFLRFDLEGNEVRTDILRDGIQRFLRNIAGPPAPLDRLFFEERNNVRALHDGRFLRIDHRKKWRDVLALVQCLLHIMQQLREHGITRKLVVILRLEPNFLRLNIDQVFRIPLQSQRLDVNILHVLLAFYELQLFEERHGYGYVGFGLIQGR